MATYGIVCSATSKMLRRVIADDDGLVSIGLMPDGVTPAVICAHHNAPSGLFPLAAGETAFVAIPPNAVSAASPAHWNTAIQNHFGVPPPIINCALIDGTNTVVQVVVADPAVDPAPAGFTMVQCYDPKVTIGCTYTPATGLFTVPSVTIPAGMPGNTTGLPLVIPATTLPKV